MPRAPHRIGTAAAGIRAATPEVQIEASVGGGLSVSDASIDVQVDGGDTIIRVRGELDDVAARALFDVATAALEEQPGLGAVEIDLRAMETWTPGGLRQLAACTGLGVRVRMGPATG